MEQQHQTNSKRSNQQSLTILCVAMGSFVAGALVYAWLHKESEETRPLIKTYKEFPNWMAGNIQFYQKNQAIKGDYLYQLQNQIESKMKKMLGVDDMNCNVSERGQVFLSYDDNVNDDWFHEKSQTVEFDGFKVIWCKKISLKWSVKEARAEQQRQKQLGIL